MPKVPQVAKLILIEEVERTNAVVVRNSLQVQGGKGGRMRRDFYAIDIDREKMCFNCRIFRHISCCCRNQKNIGEGRRIEFGNNVNTDSLKEERDQGLD